MSDGIDYPERFALSGFFVPINHVTSSITKILTW
jgi:hypothetical protein